MGKKKKYKKKKTDLIGCYYQMARVRFDGYEKADALQISITCNCKTLVFLQVEETDS